MEADKITHIGVIGCGNISDAYFNAAETFKQMKYSVCADLNMDAAQAKSETYGCRATSVEELLADPEVEIILNLTIPQAHADVNKKALEAGKHVYAEKPFALNLEEGAEVLELAKAKGLRVGCAPDTFLGGGIQTVRKLIDENWIGSVLSGTAFMMCRGHESWHPNPHFYYHTGGGPVFDMGPYYITALVNILGPVENVCSFTQRGFEERICTCESRFGEHIPVEINTHTAGILRFASSAVVSLVMSFDVGSHSCPRLELYGSEGSISLPDPNSFGGPVKYAKVNSAFEEVPIPFGYTDNMRSIGLADMACAIESGRKHRCSGKLAYHVLEIMCALEQSGTEQRFIKLSSTCERPAALPLGLLNGDLD